MTSNYASPISVYFLSFRLLGLACLSIAGPLILDAFIQAPISPYVQPQNQPKVSYQATKTLVQRPTKPIPAQEGSSLAVIIFLAVVCATAAGSIATAVLQTGKHAGSSSTRSKPGTNRTKPKPSSVPTEEDEDDYSNDYSDEDQDEDKGVRENDPDDEGAPPPPPPDPPANVDDPKQPSRRPYPLWLVWIICILVILVPAVLTIRSTIAFEILGQRLKEILTTAFNAILQPGPSVEIPPSYRFTPSIAPPIQIPPPPPPVSPVIRRAREDERAFMNELPPAFPVRIEHRAQVVRPVLPRLQARSLTLLERLNFILGIFNSYICVATLDPLNISNPLNLFVVAIISAIAVFAVTRNSNVSKGASVGAECGNDKTFVQEFHALKKPEKLTSYPIPKAGQLGNYYPMSCTESPIDLDAIIRDNLNCRFYEILEHWTLEGIARHDAICEMLEGLSYYRNGRSGGQEDDSESEESSETTEDVLENGDHDNILGGSTLFSEPSVPSSRSRHRTNHALLWEPKSSNVDRAPATNSSINHSLEVNRSYNLTYDTAGDDESGIRPGIRSTSDIVIPEPSLHRRHTRHAHLWEQTTVASAPNSLVNDSLEVNQTCDSHWDEHTHSTSANESSIFDMHADLEALLDGSLPASDISETQISNSVIREFAETRWGPRRKLTHEPVSPPPPQVPTLLVTPATPPADAVAHQRPRINTTTLLALPGLAAEADETFNIPDCNQDALFDSSLPLDGFITDDDSESQDELLMAIFAQGRWGCNSQTIEPGTTPEPAPAPVVRVTPPTPTLTQSAAGLSEPASVSSLSPNVRRDEPGESSIQDLDIDLEQIDDWTLPDDLSGNLSVLSLREEAEQFAAARWGGAVNPPGGTASEPPATNPLPPAPADSSIQDLDFGSDNVLDWSLLNNTSADLSASLDEAMKNFAQARWGSRRSNPNSLPPEITATARAAGPSPPEPLHLARTTTTTRSQSRPAHPTPIIKANTVPPPPSVRNIDIVAPAPSASRLRRSISPSPPLPAARRISAGQAGRASSLPPEVPATATAPPAPRMASTRPPRQTVALARPAFASARHPGTVPSPGAPVAVRDAPTPVPSRPIRRKIASSSPSEAPVAVRDAPSATSHPVSRETASFLPPEALALDIEPLTPRLPSPTSHLPRHPASARSTPERPTTIPPLRNGRPWMTSSPRGRPHAQEDSFDLWAASENSKSFLVDVEMVFDEASLREQSQIFELGDISNILDWDEGELVQSTERQVYAHEESVNLDSLLVFTDALQDVSIPEVGDYTSDWLVPEKMKKSWQVRQKTKEKTKINPPATRRASKDTKRASKTMGPSPHDRVPRRQFLIPGESDTPQ